MPLTPKEIEQRTFTASFRGYAEEEVDLFLEEVILSIADYQQMIRDRDARLADGGTAGAAPADVAGANEEANRILQAARRQAAQIVEEATARASEAEANATAAEAVLSPEQAADRERLLVGYERLRSELSLVRTRVQKALSASQEAFGIMEGQVETIIKAAEPAPTATPPSVAPAVASAPVVEESVAGVEDDQADTTDGDRPRRPWER